jgi:hypothetical protein
MEVFNIPPNEREKRSIALKNKHAQLDIQEPFTQREAKGLGKRNMAFIRDLQISRRINKKEAIELYASSNLKSKKHLAKLERETQKKIKDYYSQKHKFQVTGETKFEKPILKTKTKREKEQATKIKNWLKLEKEKLQNYFASEKYKRTATYQRIKAQHKQYPDATKYELVHGVNSKASQRFRLNHGLNQDYEGRKKSMLGGKTK